MKKRTKILLALAICMLTLTAFPVEASPTITVDPSLQYLGEWVTITGSCFPPGETIYLHEWNHFDLRFDTVTVAGDGTFSSTLRLDGAIPNAWTPRTILALDTKGNLLAWAGVGVLPQEWWFEPTSGPPGTIVQFHGRGMPNQHDVGGYFDEEEITTFMDLCECTIVCDFYF